MTRKELLEKFMDLPDTLNTSTMMEEPNKIIKIFNGIYSIRFESNDIKVDGTIQFEWFPSMGVYFYGTPKTDTKTAYDLLGKPIHVFVDDLEFGEGFILTSDLGSFNNDSTLKGTISRSSTLGDRSIPVEEVCFSIPNLREFHGTTTKKLDGDKISTSINRLVLDSSNFKITLDKVWDFKESKKLLEIKGGFLILYNGKIENKNKSISYEDVRKLIHSLDIFLWFLNGRRTAAVFLHGKCGTETIWTDYSNYTVDFYKSVIGWPTTEPRQDFNSIWIKFKELWMNEDDKDFLCSVMHWYVESNGHSGYSEGSLIMSQTALELIYNWWVVERLKFIAGKDAENISASNKIRLILAQLNIPSTIPGAFEKLKEYADSNQEIIDGPEAIVQIRNAIVHSQHEKRRKLSAIDIMARYQALQLSIWYIELSILKILEYQDKYFNRCSGAEWKAQGEEFVPWNKEHAR